MADFEREELFDLQCAIQTYIGVCTTERAQKPGTAETYMSVMNARIARLETLLDKVRLHHRISHTG